MAVISYFPMGGAGGAALDVTAYGSLDARPAAAEENALAIITSLAIGSVAVDVTQPTSPESGDVWIGMDVASANVLTLGEDQLRHGRERANAGRSGREYLKR